MEGKLEAVAAVDDSEGSNVKTWGNWAAISPIDSRGGWPDKLALVVAKGPVCSKIWMARGKLGTRTPIVVGSIGFMAAGTLSEAGSTKVNAPGQKDVATCSHNFNSAGLPCT